MIYTGCICENSFLFPYLEEDVDKILITYKQGNEIKFEKKREHCTIKDGWLYTTLEQEDTLKLDDITAVKIQIRGTLKNGVPIKSKVIKTYADEILNNKVI